MIRYNHAVDANKVRVACGLGLLAAMIAMTRPEGVVYFVAFPALLLTPLAWRQTSAKTALKNVVSYWIFFSWPFILFILFRVLYFGDVLPNTFYSKQTASAANLGIANLGDLLNGIAPSLGYLLVALVLAAVIYVAGKRRFWMDHLALLLVLICSLAAFSLLEADWMPELRFATCLIFFFYLFAFIIFEAAFDILFENKYAFALSFLVLVCIFVWTAIPSFVERSGKFMDKPVISFNDVGERVAPWFNRAVNQLGIENASLLCPDIGGQLYYSNLRIFDLGGLCDKTIARTWGKDQTALTNYVYDTLQPSFIFTHANWGGARIESDERLQRDYSRLSMSDGSSVYVRKTLVDGKENPLQAIGDTWNQ